MEMQTACQQLASDTPVTRPDRTPASKLAMGYPASEPLCHWFVRSPHSRCREQLLRALCNSLFCPPFLGCSNTLLARVTENRRARVHKGACEDTAATDNGAASPTSIKQREDKSRNQNSREIVLSIRII